MTARPWVVYVRVSTDEQAQSGSSLDAQENACKALLTVHGHGPIEVVREDRSGKNLNRPGIAGVLRRISAGDVVGVCVYAIDRLTRSTRDLDNLMELFDERRIEFISVSQRVDTSGPMGRFVLRLIGSIAQLEREQIAHRVRMGMQHRKALGGWLARAPAGTIAVRGTDNIRRLQADPKTGPIVGRIWPMLAEGRSLMDVADHLNAEGVRTSKRSRWTKTAVAWLASSPSVVGILVDREAWQKAQTALTARQRRRRALEDAPTPNPLSDREWALQGLCFCAGCGSAMTIKPTTGRGGRRYVYLRCCGRIRVGRDYCAAEDLSYEATEAAIIEGLALRQASGEIASASARWLAERKASMERQTGRVAELKAEHDRLTARMALVFEVVEAGGDSGRAARARLGEVQQAIDKVAGELAGLEAATAILARDEAAIDKLGAAVARGIERLPTASEADRKGILGGIIQRIGISRTAAAVTLVVPEAGVLPDCRERYSQLDAGPTGTSPVVTLTLEYRRRGQGLAASAR